MTGDVEDLGVLLRRHDEAVSEAANQLSKTLEKRIRPLIPAEFVQYQTEEQPPTSRCEGNEMSEMKKITKGNVKELTAFVTAALAMASTAKDDDEKDVWEDRAFAAAEKAWAILTTPIATTPVSNRQ